MSLLKDLYTAVLLLTVVPTWYLISVLWNHRDRPSGRWFITGLIGSSGWAVFWALSVLFRGYTLSLLCLNIVIICVAITFLSMLFIAIEYLWRTRIGYRVVVPFLVVPLVSQVLLWTNPLHHLFWTEATRIDSQGIVHPAHGPGFLLHTGYGYLLVFASVILFVIAMVDRRGLYRKQAALMLVGWLVPVSTSIVFVFDVLPTAYLNPTPLAFMLGVGIWLWASLRFRLLKTVPVARRTALAEMDEGVIMIDEHDVVTDVNAAARSLLDIDETVTGERIDAVLSRHPALLSTVQDGPVSDEIVVVSKADEQRSLRVSKTPLDEDGTPIGYVIVLKDQTALIRHEEDLELLKGVLTRVLRHDIRNKLNVIRSHGELLSHQLDSTRADKAERIVETSDDIIETAEKARVIESLVDADRRRYDIDLVRVVEDAVSWAANRFPEAVIEIDTPDEAWVRADEALSHAVRSLVENAVVHNDVDTPYVRVAVEDDQSHVRLVVEDDGPGITHEERRIFYGRSVSQMSHGSGLGLWLVDWVVRNSDGDIDLASVESGTRITIDLERCFEPTRDVDREVTDESDST